MGESIETKQLPSWEQIWEEIVRRQGQVFYTKKGLPFQYSVKGGEIFVNRRSKSITRSTLEKAFHRIMEEPEKIKGPKALNVFGAPYIWSIFQSIFHW